MVMETAHFVNGSHLTTFRRLDRASHWTIHVECKVGTKSVVIAEVSGQKTHQVLFVEHDHMVEHVTSYTANDSLTVGVLPWAPRGGLDFFDAYIERVAEFNRRSSRPPILPFSFPILLSFRF
jgi:hypothetical protein